MILTYKIKHHRDYFDELKKAKQIAQYVLEHHPQSAKFSSKDVKQFGLKSVMSNQIIRKYGRNRKLKRVNKVKLTIPNQGIQYDPATQIIKITSLKLELRHEIPIYFDTINQIEVDHEYLYVSVTHNENSEYEATEWLGVDRNTTGHVAVVASPDTGKIMKLGKSGQHIHEKYKHIRKNLQKRGKYRKVKQLKNRESRIVRDINHKISKKIVDNAYENGYGIKLEELKGIRNNKKQAKSFRYSLNSWSFYQLQTMIEYKAKLLGVPIAYIDPAYTSQSCSRCGHIGYRNGKNFQCPSCGHVEHADVNAAFNIALSPNIVRFATESDVVKGNTGIPKAAMIRKQSTVEPHEL
jgi:putative transposase